MDFVEIEILNWEKYNPRKDYKRPWWFALSNSITTDDTFSEFSDAEFRAWIHILCTASVQNTNRPKVFFKASLTKAGIKRAVLESAIEKLKILESIRIPDRICTDSVQDLYCTVQNSTIQNNTNTVCAPVKSPTAPTNFKEFFSWLPDETKKEYETLYPSRDYVSREAIKAAQWCDRNPKKTPRSLNGWKRFFSSWLDRGWERERKNLPSASDVQGAGSMRGA